MTVTGASERVVESVPVEEVGFVKIEGRYFHPSEGSSGFKAVSARHARTSWTVIEGDDGHHHCRLSVHGVVDVIHTDVGGPGIKVVHDDGSVTSIDFFSADARP